MLQIGDTDRDRRKHDGDYRWRRAHNVGAQRQSLCAARLVENLLQRGPCLGRSIVDQDLQHWKPAKQLSTGFLRGRFIIVMSLEVTVDHQREAVGRR